MYISLNIKQYAQHQDYNVITYAKQVFNMQSIVDEQPYFSLPQDIRISIKNY